MAASLNPVNAWDMRLAVVSETTFGATQAPADVAAFKTRFLECIGASLGAAAQVGVVRAKQDRGIGRGMSDGFVEGRVEPIDWNVMLALKSRTAGDTPPLELALYRAGGLFCQDAGSTYTLTPSVTPIESSHFAGVSLQRWLGSGSAAYQSEILRGGVAKSLKWEGGDKELMLTASGSGVSARGTVGVDGDLATPLRSEYQSLGPLASPAAWAWISSPPSRSENQSRAMDQIPNSARFTDISLLRKAASSMFGL